MSRREGASSARSPYEARFDYVMRRKGWTVISRGWPDRLLLSKAGKCRVVEIKGAGDKLRPDQYTVLALLHKLGIDVRISNGEEEGRVLTDSELLTGYQNLAMTYGQLGLSINNFQLANYDSVQQDLIKQGAKAFTTFTSIRNAWASIWGDSFVEALNRVIERPTVPKSSVPTEEDYRHLIEVMESIATRGKPGRGVDVTIK